MTKQQDEDLRHQQVNDLIRRWYGPDVWHYPPTEHCQACGFDHASCLCRPSEQELQDMMRDRPPESDPK